eukprot:m.42305 g.42305  ORF g.42305 m.42305 type:complete len:388 (+) comp12870_c0_seq3:538-1701(+)
MMATNATPLAERSNVFGGNDAAVEPADVDLSPREVKLPTSTIRLRLSLIGPSNRDVRQQRDGGVYICKVAPNSVMKEQVFVGDRLIKFTSCGNEVDLSTASVDTALSCLKFFESDARLVVMADPEGYRAYSDSLPNVDRAAPPSTSTTDNQPSPQDALEAVTQALNQVTVVLHHETDHCAQGIACVQNNELQAAEDHFLEALKVHMDATMTRRLTDAAKLTDAGKATAACQKVLVEAKHQKHYLKYLIGLTWLRRQRRVEATAIFVDVVKDLVPWFYYDDMCLHPNDPEFHHAVATVLASTNKLDAAVLAYQEALKLNDSEVWQQELDAVRYKSAARKHLHAEAEPAQPKLALKSRRVQPQTTEPTDDLVRTKFPSLNSSNKDAATA